MGKDKIKRFAEIETFPNVFQNPPEMPGKWRSEVFKNDNPIVLELACGRGEYTVGMSRLFPDKNHIGIDVKGARIWRGAKTCIEEGLTNGAFLRIQIELIENYFAPGEVDEIWITFPDPHPPKSKMRKRLTNPRFLGHYKNILKPGGLINLKTDNTQLYEYSLEVIKEEKLPLYKYTDNVYTWEGLNDVLRIETTYERMFAEKGSTIKYIQFGL